MTSSEGGYRIGFKELYDLVIQVSAKLDAISAQQGTQIQANTSRIEDLSKGMRLIWEQFEKYKTEVKNDIQGQRGNTWQINLAIAGSTISMLTTLAGFIIK